jgi:hypothetical protein
MRISMMSLSVRGLQAMLAEHAGDFRLGDRLVVGTNENGGDGPLHIHRAGGREKACQLVQALAIAQPVPRERVESAHLGASQAGQRRRIVHLVRLYRRRLQAITLLVELVAFVQGADQLDVGWPD